MQAAVSCISHARLAQGAATVPGRGAIQLRRWTPLRQQGGVPLSFSILYVFAAAGGRVQSLACWCELEIGNEGIQFHSHPGPGVTHPHVNLRRVGPGSHLADRHVPTGRTSNESVVRFLIAEPGAVPLREDGATVLDRTEAAFVARASWLARPPA